MNCVLHYRPRSSPDRGQELRTLERGVSIRSVRAGEHASPLPAQVPGMLRDSEEEVPEPPRLSRSSKVLKSHLRLGSNSSADLPT
eukprot:2094933-Amphidinium_carterae.1